MKQPNSLQYQNLPPRSFSIFPLAKHPHSPLKHPIKQLVFIDSRVDNYHHLAVGVVPGTQVIMLDPFQDGITQITNALSIHNYVVSIHIISHGCPGYLELGNTTLSLDNLAQYALQLQSWLGKIRQNFPIPILIYGCSVAAKEVGRKFVTQLKQLTGMEIYASAVPTGSQNLGGNWNLEVTTSKEIAPIVFTPETMATYPSILPISITSLDAEYDNLEADESVNYTIEGAGFQVGTIFNHNFQVGNLNNLIISGFTVEDIEFELIGNFELVDFNRVDNPEVTGNRQIVLFEQESLGETEINLRPSPVTTMSEALLSNVINVGIDNPFNNRGNLDGNNNNVERIDFIVSAGLSSPSFALDETGFVLLERGGNDSIKVAAITALDEEGNPGEFGDLITIETTDWGQSSFDISTAIARQDTNDPNLRYTASRESQPIAGVLITYEELGIVEGQTFYGYAVFPPDIDASNDLVGLRDFPTDTPETIGGVDLLASGIALASNVNNPPIAIDNNGTTPPQVPIYFNILVDDFDPDGDSLAITEVTQGNNGTVEVINNNSPDDPTDDFVVYIPESDFIGFDSFTYSISDGGGGFDTAIVTVEVTENTAAVDDYVSNTPNTSIVINVLDNDMGNPRLSTVTQPSNGTVEIVNNGSINDATDDLVLYTPENNFIGIDTFTYSVIDSDGELSSATVTVNVNPQQPLAGDDVVSTELATAITIDVLANDSDPNDQSLTIADVTQPTQGELVVNEDDTITFIPNEALSGTDTFTYTIVDPDGNLDTATVSVTVSTPTTVVQNENDTFIVNGSEGINQQFKFTLTSASAGFVNEVGVYLVDDEEGTINGVAPGEEAYLETVLTSGEVIFSALSETPSIFFQNPTRIIDGFAEGEQFGFYLVVNSTTDQVLADLEAGLPTANVFFSPNAANGDGLDHSRITQLEENTFLVEWEDLLGGGDRDFDDLDFIFELVESESPTGSNLQGARQQEIIDLRAIEGQVEVNFVEFKRSSLNNVGGLYAIDDVLGTVTNPVTGENISPGETDYEQAALAASIIEFNSDTSSVLLDGGRIYAPYLVAPEEGIFFPFLEANEDGLDHLRLLGDNQFGFEDTFGGGDGDFDDFVFFVDVI